MDNGRVALVSGGNRGIGLEVCRQLAERGFTVVMGSRDAEQGRAAAAELPDGVVVHQLDVADPESVEKISRSVEEEFGRLDVVGSTVADDLTEDTHDRDAVQPRGDCHRREVRDRVEDGPAEQARHE